MTTVRSTPVATQQVLVIEDEENLAEALRYTLEREGYKTFVSTDGAAGLAAARSLKPDLIVLDISLPSLSGLSICRTLRSESDVAIIMLTARGEENDRVAGLDTGADDYVVKPFSMRELVARVRAMLRRGTVPSPTGTISSGDIRIDLSARAAWVDQRPLDLTRREFNLLTLFVQNPGRAFSRDEILRQLWGEEWIGDVRTVDVHVRWLREKIESDPSTPRRLTTIRGFGYRFDG